MLKFNKNCEERKTIAKRLGELTGQQPFYTRAPRYAYEIGPYTIDRDGDLFVDEEEANADILTALMNEGLISGGEVVTEGGAEGTDEETTEDVPAETDPAETDPADEDPETDAGEEPIEEAEETVAESAAETEETPEDTMESMPSDTEAAIDEASEDAETAEPEPANEEADSEQDTTDTDVSDSETSESESTVADSGGEETIDLDMNFEIALGAHTGTTMRNLFNLIYSRGPLINKATGGHFSVDEELIEVLKDDSCIYTMSNFLHAVADYEDQHGKSIYGLTITPESVSFTGFGTAPDVEHLRAYGHLAVLMNTQALTQKRIQAKKVNDTNEKYAMRIWMVRIGMGGDEYKTTRRILMENLSGHTAFRTAEDAEKAKVKAQKKRDALKAAKAAAMAAEQETLTAEAMEAPVEHIPEPQLLEAGA